MRTDMTNNNLVQTNEGMGSTMADERPFAEREPETGMAPSRGVQQTAQMPALPSNIASQSNMPRVNMENIPETLANPIYTAGFLSTQVGRLMRVEFLIGNSISDRVGRLIEVGASYILLQSIDPGSMIMCDLYSIKFVTIVDENLQMLYR